jgi:hypothetical protein
VESCAAGWGVGVDWEVREQLGSCEKSWCRGSPYGTGTKWGAGTLPKCVSLAEDFILFRWFFACRIGFWVQNGETNGLKVVT